MKLISLLNSARVSTLFVFLLVVFSVGYGATPAAAQSDNGLQRIGVTVAFGTADVHSGPDQGFNVLGQFAQGSRAEAVAQSVDDRFTYLIGPGLSGWVATGLLRPDGGLSDLPVWRQGKSGARFVAVGRSVAADGQLDVRSGPDHGYNVMASLAPSANVTILAQSQDGAWRFVESAERSGWIESDHILSDSNLSYLPVWTDVMRGAIFDQSRSTRTIFLSQNTPVRHGFGTGYRVRGYLPIGTEVDPFAKSPDGAWLFVIEERASGWVQASDVVSIDTLESLPVWRNTIPVAAQ